ncbi:MAG: erythromycin esterase family protein [Flavobacteriales bacterium]|nr:erythromycin esterase family protein [Flavobacteriales bacterium]
MLRSLFCVVLLTIALSLCSQQKVVLSGLEETVYPFSLDEGGISTNWQGLKNLFLEKKIIAMGEATHGTHEFFETKMKVFQFLVEECHYRVFAIEASYGAEMYVNDYVSGKTNDIALAMKYLDWPWGTEEVKNLVEWIRQYNHGKEASDQIAFYGFDMQNISIGIQYLSEAYFQDSSTCSMSFQKIAHMLTDHSEYEVYQMISKDNLRMRDTLYHIHQEMKEWLSRSGTEITTMFGSRAYDKIHRAVQNYEQSLDFHFCGLRQFGFRDSCMAENVIAIQKMENRNMFLWAHNGHVALQFRKLPVMGTYLKKIFHDQYYAIGFVFDHGHFMAYKGPDSMAGALIKFAFHRKKLYRGLMDCSVASMKKNTLTTAFKQSHVPAWMIDLHSTNNPLFETAQRYYDIGASFLNERRASTSVIAKDEFDGLIYFESTQPTILLKKS